MQRCPSCGAEVDENVDSCPSCGAEFEVVTCKRCGTEFQGADACPACGALVVPVKCDRHPDRPAVGRCVVCGTAVCEECRAGDRRATRCAEHRAVPVIEGWAQVYSTNRDFEAHLVADNLRAEGIDAQIFSQRDNMFTVELGDLSLVRLLVPAWQYRTALSIIREHMDTEGEVTFACPACGEAYEPGATECSSCGAPLA